MPLGKPTGTLTEQVIAAALKAGGGEASTESQYLRALAWIDGQRPNATSTQEQAALDEATGEFNRKLARLRGGGRA